MLLDETLRNPVNAELLKLSNLILAEAEADNPQYALQLSLFSSLQGAKMHARKLAADSITLSQPPTIFKIEDLKRSWYILALGPFSNQTELADNKTNLQNQAVDSLAILWPPPPED